MPDVDASPHAPLPAPDAPTPPDAGRRLRTDELDYELPASAIATSPAEPRDHARLLVCHRDVHSPIQHARVRDLPSHLAPGDLLVFNTTRVAPCRFLGHRLDSGGKVEGLVIGPGPVEGLYLVMVRMRRQKPGVVISIHDRGGHECGVHMHLIERSPSDDSSWLARVTHEHDTDTAASRLLPPTSIWDRVGLTPLPPYILSARRSRGDEAGDQTGDDADRAAYQTVFAERPTNTEHDATPLGPTPRTGLPGIGASVAAPTAGLHFTPELLAQLTSAGVRTANVTLHVGLGTFKPVECDWVNDHPMHTEWCRVPIETSQAIEQTRATGNRIIAVGTTTARTLESFDSIADLTARGPLGIDTRILITPGRTFRHVDALLTNFHLPRSTLMALVAAFLESPTAHPSHPDGVARLIALYREAIAHDYRFYSFGDAMLILP